MSDLVGNPNCWFCHAKAIFILILVFILVDVTPHNGYQGKMDRYNYENNNQSKELVFSIFNYFRVINSLHKCKSSP